MAQLDWKNGVGYIPAMGDEYGNAAKLIQQSLGGIGSAIGELGDRNSLEQLKMYSNPDDYNTALQNGNVRTNNASTKALSDMLAYMDTLQKRRDSDTVNIGRSLDNDKTRESNAQALLDNANKNYETNALLESTVQNKLNTAQLNNTAQEETNMANQAKNLVGNTKFQDSNAILEFARQYEGTPAYRSIMSALKESYPEQVGKLFGVVAVDANVMPIGNSAPEGFTSLPKVPAPGTLNYNPPVPVPGTTPARAMLENSVGEKVNRGKTVPPVYEPELAKQVAAIRAGKLPVTRPGSVWTPPADERAVQRPGLTSTGEYTDFTKRNLGYNRIPSQPKDITNSQSMGDAIFGTESSSGKADTSKANSQGARGPMQITEQTFKGLQDQGMIPKSWSHANAEQSKAAGYKFVDILWKKFNGDPAKVAASYYSSPEVINKDGTINIHWGNNTYRNHPTVGEYILKTTGINLMYAGDPAQQLATNQQQQQGNAAPNGASTAIAQAAQQNMPTPAATPPAAASASAGTNFTNTIDSKQPFDAERFAARASDLVVDANKALQQVSGVPGEYFDYSKLGLEDALAKAKALNWEGDNLNRLYNEAKKVPELRNLNDAQLAVIAHSAGVKSSDDKYGFGYFNTEAMAKIVRQAKAASGSDYTVNKEILTGLEGQRSSMVKQIAEADTALSQLNQNYKLTGNPSLLQNIASVQAQKDGLVRKLEGNMNQTSAINGRILKSAPKDKSGGSESKDGRAPTTAEDLAIQGGVSERKENTWIPSMFLSKDAVEPDTKKAIEMQKAMFRKGNDLIKSGDKKAGTEYINKSRVLVDEYLDKATETNKESRLFEKTLAKEVSGMKDAALLGETYKKPLIPPSKIMSPSAIRKYVEYRKLYNSVTK